MEGQKLVGLLKSIIKQLKLGEVDFQLTRPANEEFGDWSTNLALTAAKSSHQNPMAIAEKVKDDLQEQLPLWKIEVASPGFVNLTSPIKEKLKTLQKLSIDGLESEIEKWGSDKRVLVEYSSPNIAKRFSAGHLRSTIIGDALTHLYRLSGFEVVTDNHLGDWGTQFGMIIAAVEERELNVAEMSVAELEDLYVEFNRRLETELGLREKAQDAFLRLERGDKKARKIWLLAKKISMEEFKAIYHFLGVSFDHYYGESDYEEVMKEIIPELQKKIATKSQGAWIIEYPDLPPAMVIKSNGTTTYFTRDLATVKFRQNKKELKSDLYIYEVGAEQTSHFRQVFRAASLMGWAKENQLIHVAHGLMTLPEGRMSTRKGNTIKLDEWLKLAEQRAQEMGKKDVETKKIALAAIKYNELRHAPTSNYVFTWDEALNMEGDSAPYLLYAYVRASKIIQNAKIPAIPLSYELNNEELSLLRWLVRFGEIIKVATLGCSPNLVCSYLFELASRFNCLYNQHRILQAETEEAKIVRLKLTKTTLLTLKAGLDALGIPVVTKM